MTANTVQSRKAKGRKHQQWIRDKLRAYLKVEEADIESRSMGASGEDIMLSPLARSRFPFSIEAKAQENVNLWKSYEQAQENAGKYEPIVVITKAHKKPVVVIDADYFFKLFEHKDLNTSDEKL